MTVPHTCYLIAASPRSGSQLLGSLLAATGLAGNPDEHFNPWYMGDATNFFPDDLLYGPKHIQHLIAEHTTPNGVFGTKTHFLQVTNFVGLDRLENLYPKPLKYIYLRRKDVERQGVSLARAAQTDAYNSETSEKGQPVYDFHLISKCTREVRVQDKGWRTYFYNRGLEPHVVIYEELVMDRARILRGVLQFLGVSIPQDFQVPETHLKKQADSISDEWVEKFRRGDLT
jgi:trehalose 2-sulfotransferase